MAGAAFQLGDLNQQIIGIEPTPKNGAKVQHIGLRVFKSLNVGGTELEMTLEIKRFFCGWLSGVRVKDRTNNHTWQIFEALPTLELLSNHDSKPVSYITSIAAPRRKCDSWKILEMIPW